MSAFSYKAFDSNGKMVKGVIEGDSERQVRSQLRLQQLKPVAVTESAEKIAKPRSGFNLEGLFKPRISQADLCLITRQMATLVQSNMPLDEVLTATAQQARKPRIKSLMLQVRARVLEGHSLAYALGDFPQIFNEMYCSMVKAGETAGFLGTVLEQLADYTENSQHTAQKLKGAMIYPIILTLLSVAVIGVLMIFVVPDLVSMFNHTKQELPALTKIVIATSEFFSEKWWTLIVGLIVVIVGWRQLLKSPERRKVWHRIVLKLPFISGFVVAMDTARFASTLSILTSSGVPLLDGLRIAGEVLTNLRLREASKEVAITVQEGGSLHRALDQAEVFPPMMVHMVASGEASGELENMLARSALTQQRELDMSLDNLMGVFEPMMILVMAAVVCTIVFSILMPIIQMNNLVA
ncbi:MAG: type II secretion system inner membrane protein GspF [Oceanicoccus sp.]|uniref:type II secretion system inner membrane protein GspF n=1 Tax=Oceanicoccus sp. TaxID=2691044 RepID=UPI00261DD5B3|nr:type II secretion system inner membrane protein GspF [Oceanicoccus sp.]MCP3908217.1 type II secretion system inner membrane protein GspF [Oceanicoccus sp.]MDG1773875.1 type II secretion system inner membrane protein GspF [Oceanicoccus sp.]